MSNLRICIIFFTILLVMSCEFCDSKRSSISREKKLRTDWVLRETNQVNFIRLVIMRLIYGIAAQFGLQERLINLFSGAFLPPNADYDDDDDDYDLDVF